MSVNGYLAAVKQTLASLAQVEDVPGCLAKFSLEELVSLGQWLWWINKRSLTLLELVKSSLREKALANSVSGTSLFVSPDGAQCLVIPQVPTLVVKKDADISGLRTMLGDRFGEFFEEMVTYKTHKSFQTYTANCPQGEQNALLDSVDLVSRRSRVVFKD